jgi:hypothetical protein
MGCQSGSVANAGGSWVTLCGFDMLRVAATKSAATIWTQKVVKAFDAATTFVPSPG